jgi:hypothetical protein
LGNLTAEFVSSNVVIRIGGVAARVASKDRNFLLMLERRYAGFVEKNQRADLEFQVELEETDAGDPDADVRVVHRSGEWFIERGDLRAEWNPRLQRGWIRQSPNPYSIDAVLRILHSLILADEGGFLLHAASVIRNHKAYLFSGVSGAGKTTIARLAPPDVTLLTDEISYIRRERDGYWACGTPFTGELQKLGENVAAPIGAIYLLAQGRENRVDAVPTADAVRALMGNILFFAEDAALVRSLFDSACECVGRIPVLRLTFLPEPSVWALIQ